MTRQPGGDRYFDFLRGDERYKYGFGEVDVCAHTWLLPRASSGRSLRLSFALTHINEHRKGMAFQPAFDLQHASRAADTAIVYGGGRALARGVAYSMLPRLASRGPDPPWVRRYHG